MKLSGGEPGAGVGGVAFYPGRFENFGRQLDHATDIARGADNRGDQFIIEAVLQRYQNTV